MSTQAIFTNDHQQQAHTISPVLIHTDYSPAERLAGENIIITGGDGALAQSVALHALSEKANVILTYQNAEPPLLHASMMKNVQQQLTCKKVLLNTPLRCHLFVDEINKEFGRLSGLINCYGTVFHHRHFLDITADHLQQVFTDNILHYFYLTQAVLPHLHENDSIVNTTHIHHEHDYACLVDYEASKGAVLSFTQALSRSLFAERIKVNAIEPGPVMVKALQQTPPCTVNPPRVNPADIAPAYIKLCERGEQFCTGQVLYPANYHQNII